MGAVADRVLDLLENVRPNGKSRWTARCPGHADKTSSLSIRDTDDRVLIYCFAGCPTSDVLNAVGLEIQDLFLARGKSFRPVETQSQRLEREFKREHPKANQDFFKDWLELRSTGWRETGAPIGRAAMQFAANANVPDLPGELIAHHMLGQSVPLERPPFGQSNLEALASWIAECLRPAFHSLESVTTAESRTTTRPTAPVFDPLAKYQRKLERLTRGAR